MSSDSSPTRLEHVLNFANGRTSPDRADHARYPVYGSNGLIGRAGEKNSEPNTIVIGRVGSYCGSVHFSKDACWVTDNAIRATAKHDHDPVFLYYLLKHLNLNSWRSGSGQPLINQATLNSIEAPIPDPTEQRAISGVIGALDDRITLLRETNATLEAIAQALFKSWFVDFDPVRAKMAGRAPEGMDEATAALFPDALEETELGVVPRGWRIDTLGNMCTVTIGGLWGNDECGDSDLTPAISLRGVDLENLRADGFAKNAPVRWVKPSAMEKRRLGQNEVLIASSGAGPCGRPLWAGARFELFYGMPVIFSNFVKRLECGSPARAIYIDRLLAEMRETREIWNYINGTSIPNLDDKLLLATKKVVVPDTAVLSAFESVARTIFERLYSQQAQTLFTLRDTLLPRLISGQLSL